jgi:exoribonuclease II
MVRADQALHDRLWADAESLLAICRRHAVLVPAGLAEAQASRLAACRVIWTNYAAAFNASPAMQERFADELQDVTRALMAAQMESAGALADSERLPATVPQATLITIEELRPLLQQIIRQ